MGALRGRAAAAAAAAGLVLASGVSSALAIRGQVRIGWARILSREEARYPAIAPLAASRVAGDPDDLRVAFVAGAIGGWRERQVCPLLARDPDGFARAARRVLFGGRTAAARRAHWPVAGLVRSYRDGVAFGCRVA